MKKVWIIVIIALITGSYFAGVYTTVNHTFPYSNLKFIYKQINFNENEIDLDVNVNSLIHIKTIEDIQKNLFTEGEILSRMIFSDEVIYFS